MRKTLNYGYKSLHIAWKANGIYAPLSIFSRVYDSTFYPLIQIFLLARLLDLLNEVGQITFSDISWIILSYILATIIKLSTKSFIDVKDAFLQSRMESYIDFEIGKKLSTLDPATFEDAEFQDLIAQLDGIKGSLQAHLLRFTGFLDAILKFATASVVVAATFPVFIPLIIFATIPSYVAWDKFRIKTWHYFVDKKSRLIRITQYVKSLLSSAPTSKEVAIFNTGPSLLKMIKKERQKYYQEFEKANDSWIVWILFARLLQLGAFAYTQSINLSSVLTGALGVGQFTLVFQQTLNLTFSSEEILNQYSSISARNKYLDKYFDFMNKEKFIQSPKNSTKIPKKPKPVTIEFKNVSFVYPSTERYILKDFNLTIKSGEKIALVGENGAGKTTIIKLLLRFYDVTSGKILINGVDIKHIDLEQWHQQVGALFQDFIKYQFTFKENVYFGDLKKKQKEKYLKSAIEKSGAVGFLENLPNKYDQVMGKKFDGGIELSGGQWQKLALARAFFRDAPILILDEPTSAIDAKAEYEIFQRVQKLQKDKTVIIISHRFSTVRNADRILVLDEGKVVEQGDHESLTNKKGLYEELFNIQAQGYK